MKSGKQKGETKLKMKSEKEKGKMKLKMKSGTGKRELTFSEKVSPAVATRNQQMW